MNRCYPNINNNFTAQQQCCNPCNPCCPKPNPRPSNTPFLSCYIEAIGNAQTVANENDIVFDISNDALDIAGLGISLNNSGTTFTINTPGLYHIEWSANLSENTIPAVLGLMENNEPASGISCNTAGSISSGALIQVGYHSLPYTIKLHNFLESIRLENIANIENTAVSLRILRFADGPLR